MALNWSSASFDSLFTGLPLDSHFAAPLPWNTKQEPRIANDTTSLHQSGTGVTTSVNKSTRACMLVSYLVIKTRGGPSASTDGRPFSQSLTDARFAEDWWIRGSLKIKERLSTDDGGFSSASEIVLLVRHWWTPVLWPTDRTTHPPVLCVSIQAGLLSLSTVYMETLCCTVGGGMVQSSEIANEPRR